MQTSDLNHSVKVALCWCLAWGTHKDPPQLGDLSLLHQMLTALRNHKDPPDPFLPILAQVDQLLTIPATDFPQTLQPYQHLWDQDTPIGLVYGGATKIKQYVFESAKLPYIRGASALLDRINLVDLPAFFGVKPSTDDGQGQQPDDTLTENDQRQQTDEELRHQKAAKFCQDLRTHWLEKSFPGLAAALIPELIIYSTGGNILSFCPAAWVDDLANAIERRYTEETLTANSCAVGDHFRLLEIRFGLLQDPLDQTFWLQQYQHHANHPLIQAYFARPNTTNLEDQFRSRKSFNELVGALAARFYQRRNGNDHPSRPSRHYPPVLETHPYLQRDESESRSAVHQAKYLPNSPQLSEVTARKRIMGQITKRGKASKQWWESFCEDLDPQARKSPSQDVDRTWEPGDVESWVQKFQQSLDQSHSPFLQHLRNYRKQLIDLDEARSLQEIGQASDPPHFVAYIYADGNNMGGYIQTIQTPQQYRQFSLDISDATEQSVYAALDQHLKPVEVKRENQDPRTKEFTTESVWIYPFEILTIGGDDVFLIVPADKALQIAQMIGQTFEDILVEKGYHRQLDQAEDLSSIHRFNPNEAKPSLSELSMSAGVLMTAEDTPIYYAENLTNQLLKSAKKRAKDLKKQGYTGGTIDFLVLKSVTMISSSISDFRSQALVKEISDRHKLKLYASPYTLHEINGILATTRAMKQVDFPRSQLYQIRSLLEQGKHTAILNYRYFRVRQSQPNQKTLESEFEAAWCQAKTNAGNLAPWMYDPRTSTYETIWRELIDLYPFISKEDQTHSSTPSHVAQISVEANDG